MKIAIRIWFCLAVATLAADIADALVETASDRGWFGPGQFTDHSLWVIGPAMLAGLACVVMHLFLRVREGFLQHPKPSLNWLQLARVAVGRRVFIWMPFIFALQLAILYAMQATEQFHIYGHLLGGLVWLDGPVAISVSVNALMCVLVTCAGIWLVRTLANATAHFVKLVLRFSTLRERGFERRYRAYRPVIAFGQPIRALRCIGERAPPLLTA